jgi:hypothetical protein
MAAKKAQKSRFFPGMEAKSTDVVPSDREATLPGFKVRRHSKIRNQRMRLPAFRFLGFSNS